MSIQIGSEKHLDIGASIVINKSEENIQADAFFNLLINLFIFY